MTASTDKSYEHLPLVPGQLASALQRAVEAAGLDPEKLRVSLTRELEGGIRHSSDGSISTLWPVCDLELESVHGNLKGERPGFELDFSISATNRFGTSLRVLVRDAMRLSPFIEAVEAELHLVPRTEESAVRPRLGAVRAQAPLRPPESVSVAWLARHVPVRTWLAFGGLLVSAFLAGAVVGQTDLVRQLLKGTGIWQQSEHAVQQANGAVAPPP